MIDVARSRRVEVNDVYSVRIVLLQPGGVGEIAETVFAVQLERHQCRGNSGGGLDGLFDAIGPLTEGLPRLLATAEDLLHNLSPLLQKTGEAVDSVKGGVNDIVPRATQLLDGLKTTSESADVAIKRLDKLIEGVDGPVKADLVELKASLVKIQGTLTSANQLLGHTDKNLDAAGCKHKKFVEAAGIGHTYRPQDVQEPAHLGPGAAEPGEDLVPVKELGGSEMLEVRPLADEGVRLLHELPDRDPHRGHLNSPQTSKSGVRP